MAAPLLPEGGVDRLGRASGGEEKRRVGTGKKGHGGDEPEKEKRQAQVLEKSERHLFGRQGVQRTEESPDQGQSQDEGDRGHQQRFSKKLLNELGPSCSHDLPETDFPRP